MFSRFLTSVTIVLAGNTGFLLADEPANDLAVLKPFLNEHTVAVVAVDLSRVDLAALKKQYLDPLCRTNEELARVSAAVEQLQDWSKRFQVNGVRQVYLLVSTANMPQLGLERGWPLLATSAPYIVVPGLNNDTLAEIQDRIATKTKEIRQKSASEPVLKCGQVQRSTFIAFDKLFDVVAALPASPRPEFEAALQAAGKEPVRVAIVPPAIFARAAQEILLQPLPGMTKPVGPILARGVRWTGASIEPNPEQFSGRLVIQSADTEGARELSDLLRQAVAILGSSLMEKREYKGTVNAAAIGTLLPKVEGDRLVLELDAQVQVMGRQTLGLVMTSTFRRDSVSNLKHIGLALHNYHAANKHFPEHFPEPAIRDKDGKPLLSWRVMILPYIEEIDLYKEFHLDEPWDSEHNCKLIDRMPRVLRNPDTASLHPGRTRYLAPVGENLAFTVGQPHSVKDFTDGTSHTIFVVEADADHAVVWTKPEDLELDPSDPARALKNGSGTFLATYADGSVRTIRDSVDAKVLKATFTRNGGELEDASKY